MNGWKQIPEALAGQHVGQQSPPVRELAHLLLEIAPPGTVVTVKLIKRYADAINAVTRSEQP